MFPTNQIESHSQSANGLKRPFAVKNKKYGPCYGADFYNKMTSCPGVGMIHFSAARPGIDKYKSIPPPGGGGLDIFSCARKDIVMRLNRS